MPDVCAPLYEIYVAGTFITVSLPSATNKVVEVASMKSKRVEPAFFYSTLLLPALTARMARRHRFAVNRSP
jgi:hypothetical protein